MRITNITGYLTQITDSRIVITFVDDNDVYEKLRKFSLDGPYSATSLSARHSASLSRDYLAKYLNKRVSATIGAHKYNFRDQDSGESITGTSFRLIQIALAD